MLTMPLDVAVPSPEAMSTLPPVLTVLRPAWARQQAARTTGAAADGDQHRPAASAGGRARPDGDGSGVAGLDACRS